MRTSEAHGMKDLAAIRGAMGGQQPTTTVAGLSRRALWARDEEFLALLRGYRRHGGLARQRELLQRGLSWPAPEEETLCVRFDWANQTWLPVFQFEPATTIVRADVQRVVRELGKAFDGWHLARWFVEPNSWLGGRAPVDAIVIDLEAVCDAARADRFVAMG